MNGSQLTRRSSDELKAVRARGESKTDWGRVQAAGDYVWDGQDEDDRPASEAELQAALAVSRRGRPLASVRKVSTTVRFDADIVAAFRTTGRGWQTRMNAALREWLTTHGPA